ncbi:MAG: HAMP domain-containing sensor histidine kinase [Alphaproteobacteria bacterium]
MHRRADAFIQLPRRRLFSALELHAAAIGTVAAAVLILGWGFRIQLVQSVFPDFPTMKPRTAMAFMALSLSAMLSLRPSQRSRIASSVVAAGVVGWMVWLLAAYWNRTTDDLPILLPIQATMLSLMLGGLAMLVINLAPKVQAAAAIMVWLASVPALYRIFGLILFWGSPSEPGSPLSSMALHTAILVVWFMTACILMHPRLTYSEGLFAASLRGRVLRVSLPFAVGVPLAVAILSLVLSRALHWQSEPLFAVAASISVIVGATLIWRLSTIIANWQAEANAHAGRLSRANEALEQYASSAAHDLKAPARHVMLYGELLQEALARNDIETAQRYARSIRESVAELPVMIDGLLNYSRSAHTKLNLGEPSLSELVQAAGALQAADLKAAGASVAVLHEALLPCDPQLMTVVFQNLIANSLKSRRKDRQLTIRIDAERDGDVWEVSVEDNGVGFDPAFASVAFNSLARGVAPAGEGSGIGLATCRTIIQSHGGEIRVDPTFRDGARIEFTLPAPRQDDTPGR